MLYYRITNIVSVLHVHTYFGHSFGHFQGGVRQMVATSVTEIRI